MLLEHRRRKQRGFEAVCRVMASDAAKTAERGAAWWRLGVVGKIVQVALHLKRRAQPRNQTPLG
jgi:hypothetical protein